jgi:hypothetical protein
MHELKIKLPDAQGLYTTQFAATCWWLPAAKRIRQARHEVVETWIDGFIRSSPEPEIAKVTARFFDVNGIELLHSLVHQGTLSR